MPSEGEVRMPCGYYNECLVSLMEFRGSVFYLYCLKCTRYPHTDGFIQRKEEHEKMTRGEMALKYFQPRKAVD